MPEEERQPNFRMPAVIVAAIALAAVVGLVVGLRDVASDAERSASRDVPVVEQHEALKSEEKPTDVAEWPAGTAAYTVVLMEVGDESVARRRATAAVGAGVQVGVLDSDLYPSLEPNGWVLFAGRFGSREVAAEEAARYAALGFPNATPGFVGDPRDPES